MIEIDSVDQFVATHGLDNIKIFGDFFWIQLLKNFEKIRLAKF